MRNALPWEIRTNKDKNATGFTLLRVFQFETAGDVLLWPHFVDLITPWGKSPLPCRPGCESMVPGYIDFLEPLFLYAEMPVALRVKLLRIIQEREADSIRYVPERSGENRTRAAKVLGIDRVSLWRKLKKYGMDEQQTRCKGDAVKTKTQSHADSRSFTGETGLLLRSSAMMPRRSC